MEETTSCCSITVCVENTDKLTYLEHSFQTFLQDIKMPFDIIEFVGTANSPAVERTELFEKPGILARNSQSLAVCLFLRESSDHVLTHQLEKQLRKSPWKLNHVIETPPYLRPQKIARQEFYNFSNEFPLWSLNTVHYGNEHVRFHINVRNLRAMKKFYETLTDRKAKHCGQNFCFLTIYSENGFDIQIGLKKSAQVLPTPSKSCRLKFKIQSVSPFFKYLVSETKLTEETNYVLEDPDGNEVIVERSYAKVDEGSLSFSKDHGENDIRAELGFRGLYSDTESCMDDFESDSRQRKHRLDAGLYQHQDCRKLKSDYGRYAHQEQNNNYEEALNQNNDEDIKFV